MYWLLTKLNDRYTLVSKEDYNYRCTFMWGVLGCVVTYSFLLFLVVVLPLMLLGLLIAPWIPSAFNFLMANVDAEKLQEQKELSLFMFGLIGIFFMICNKKLRDVTTRIIYGAINLNASVSITMNRFSTFMLDTFCKKI
jgi:hypothetical protein